MTVQQVLYHFQHRLLPMWFYNSPKEFIGVLSEKPDALFEILSVLLERGDVENTFRAGEFKVEPIEVNDDSMAIKIKYPKPADAPLCHGAVAFFNKDFDDLAFFTVEVGEDIEGGFPVLCAWDKDGNHINYGKVSPDTDEQFVECLDKYLGIAK
ncbi:MAG: hypothetical protein K6A91_05100 [Clostridia bacterium]|nr:hypothetical protein [Clostridia bacterium]